MQVPNLSIFFLVFFTLGCSATSGSKNDSDDKFMDAIMNRIEPKWHDLSPARFKLQLDDNQSAAHPFWDVAPNVNPSTKGINVFVTTLAGSPFKYNFHLKSGQTYTASAYCPQADVWKKREEQVFKPPFTTGIVPRMLDQLSRPQKIIIFGDEEYLGENKDKNFYNVRIVGSYIEQECPIGGCLEPKSWLSRIVLVAVSPQDSKFEDIKDIDQLKESVDWEQVVNFIENAHGVNELADKNYPAYRFGSLLDVGRTFYILKNKSFFFTIDDMKSLKVSCFKLFDTLWSKWKPVNADPKEKQAEQKKSEPAFYQVFGKYYSKYYNDLKTCNKYVYSYNYNNDRSRAVFFIYLEAFEKLNTLGYVYSCRSKSWVRNPVKGNSERAYAISDQFKRCSSQDIDTAFERSILFLQNLNDSKQASYKFIDFDRHSTGTHAKIYSWAKTDNKKQACIEEPEIPIYDGLKVFPREFKWERRAIKSKFNKNDLFYR